MKQYLYLFTIIASISIISAQGLTTSGVNGYVKNQSGEALKGANVVATHTPSGTSGLKRLRGGTIGAKKHDFLKRISGGFQENRDSE